MKRLFALTFIGIFLSLNTTAQEIIPFRLNKHNNIIVQAVINKQDTVDLMFQLAMREASLSPIRTKKVESVKFDTREFPEGLSKINSIEVAKTVVDSIWIWDNEYTGYEADGKIGTQLMQGKIFKMDYDKLQFELYDALPSTKEYTELPFKTKAGQMFIQIQSVIDQEQLTGDFLLQSGFSGAILYNNDFSDKNNLESRLKILKTTSMKNSAGQVLNNLICVFPKISIAQETFLDVPVNIFTGEFKNQPTSYIGADLIHRFNWIFDIKQGVAYIQKNKYFKDQYYF